LRPSIFSCLEIWITGVYVSKPNTQKYFVHSWKYKEIRLSKSKYFLGLPSTFVNHISKLDLIENDLPSSENTILLISVNNTVCVCADVPQMGC